MSLIDDIRSDLISESSSVSNTLRKAKILASELGSPEFREWVDSEINGYADMKKVPSYRRSQTYNFGNFYGPFQRSRKNVILPIVRLPSPVKEFAENLIFSQGVGELEEMLKGGSEDFCIAWPQEYVILAREAVHMTGGMQLAEAYQPILPAHVAGVLDKIKNRLLDFILGLQENDITAENLKSGEVKQETVRNLFNIKIYGGNNVVASGENVQQQANPIRQGDITSLLDHLSHYGISKEDLCQLNKAVSDEPQASNGELGPKVKAWVGEMIAKASSGAWKIGLASAPSVLMEALKNYYGG